MPRDETPVARFGQTTGSAGRVIAPGRHAIGSVLVTGSVPTRYEES